MGRPLGPPRRGRGAASREGALHGRPRARSARLACGDRPLAAGPCARDRGRVGRARPPGRPRRAHRRRRRLALAAVPGGDRVTGAALRGRRRTRPATSASRSPWWSRRIAISPRMPPSSSPWSTSRSSPSSSPRPPRRSTTAASTTATWTTHSRAPTWWCARASACRASPACRSSATASSATGTSPAGRLTAWANFQGPFTLHGVAAAALGLRADRLRLLTPPDSGGSFGVKAAILPYVVLVGLAIARARRPRPLDRGPGGAPRRRAPSPPGVSPGWRRASRPRASSSRCATTPSRTSARTSALPSRRPSTACTDRCPAPTASGTSRPGTASS